MKILKTIFFAVIVVVLAAVAAAVVSGEFTRSMAELHLTKGAVSQLTMMSFFLALAGGYIGNVLRKIAMPDVYYAEGFVDMLYKRFFWKWGPQLIGIGLGAAALLILLQHKIFPKLNAYFAAIR